MAHLLFHGTVLNRPHRVGPLYHQPPGRHVDHKFKKKLEAFFMQKNVYYSIGLHYKTSNAKE